MMIHSVLSFRFRLTAVAIAASAACMGVHAEAEPEEGQKVQTTVSVGVGMVNGTSADRAMFGQYNGLRKDSNALALLGIDYSSHNPETSDWIDFQGENLLGDTREMRLVWKNPGDWKFTANYGELIHYDPNTINSGMLNLGSTTPQALVLPNGPGSGSEFELKTKRTALGVGFSKYISPSVQLDVDLKSENKEGSRLFGIGMSCPSVLAPCGSTTNVNTGWALLMLPEPINTNHSQIEARINYSQEKLRVSAGYYGSFYRNGNSTLNPGVPGSLNNPLGSPLALSSGLQALLSQSVALPPDNQAHQLDLTGNYAFTDKTQGTFKFGYSSATQNSDFASAGLTGAPAGVANLGGKVDTTLMRLGVTSRPIPKLSLLADWRYEDKDDQTPIAYYNFVSAAASYTNRRLPSRKDGGKLQASWQFSSAYRATVGADYEAIDRGMFASSSAIEGMSALRQKTEETGLRAELRRQMTENFSGSVSISSSTRNGSNWLRDNSGSGVTEVSNPADPVNGFLTGSVFMPSLADRKRDKVRVFSDWQPTQKLTLQFSAEEGVDRYSSPSVYGLQDTRMNSFGVDWTYAHSFNWNFNGYLSQGLQTFKQSRYAGYLMAFENTSINAGVGFTGKLSSNVMIGGSLAYSDDKSVYAQRLEAFASADSAALLAATGGLPDVVYSQTALKFFGIYTLDKQSTVRVDVVHQQTSVNDWAWRYNNVPFAYSDGTTVALKQSQSAGFIGITYAYRFK